VELVLTGATGFIGSEVLRQLVARPDVTRVTCLVRRPLTNVASDRVESVVVDDFSRYDGDLSGHDACIWAMGSRSAPGGDVALHERLSIDYPVRFLDAVGDRPFRFCYVSGWGSDPVKTPRLLGPASAMKGRAEAALRRAESQRPALRVYCFRPAMVLPQRSNPLLRTLLGPLSVGVAVLARTMIEVAVDAPPDAPPVFTNARLRNGAAAGT
jgi:nucleoside-diphosphate-sugar epimerase